jgi:hypothetical protein
MTISRDTWLALGLVTVLMLVTIAAALQQSRSAHIPFLSTSSAPDGTLALQLWLDELGYSVVDETPAAFELPAGTDLLIILQPLIPITAADWETIDAWVDSGGTLILAERPFWYETSAAHYEFQTLVLSEATPALTTQTPLLTSPPLTAAAPVRSEFFLASERTDFVTHLAIEDRPVLVSFEQGRGRVILSATPYPFSNLALKDEANAALVLNLIALSARRGGVWLDDWHHGVAGSSIVGPDQWLRSTSFGHALLFVAGAVFFALLLRGRRFGRPVPLPHEIRRRGPLEHVNAIANLNRKAGHRDPVLQQYRMRLKRHLGRRYRLDPSLADREYVEALAAYNPALDRADLLDLLGQLARPRVSEGELLKLAARASDWINER